jgi:hypothetical protein
MRMSRTRLLGAAAALSVPMALGIGGVASAATTSPASQSCSSSCSGDSGSGGDSGQSTPPQSLLPELGADLNTLLNQLGGLLD